MTTIADQLEQLVVQVADNCNQHGATLVAEAEAAAHLELLWLHFLQTTQTTKVADSLLGGVVSAIHEAVACVALGLVRPALNSLRLQLDLVLAWLYFKDHAVEWGRVQTTGDGFKLKTELIKYLGESFDRFGDRYGILKQIKTRTTEDPYRLLSAHIHGQSEHVLPCVNVPSDIVASQLFQKEFVALQAECSEFISDILWAVYADHWQSVPAPLLHHIEARFKTPAQKTTFFA